MRADAARNRRVILDGATELVARHGSEVTMDGLAARCGLAVGTLYRHFPTKEALVSAVVEDTLERMAPPAEAALGRTRDGASAWDELTGFWAALAEGPHASRSTRLAAAALGIRLRDDGGLEVSDPAPAGRVLRALTGLVEAAQGAGEMREDVELADLFLLLAQAPDHDRPDLRRRYLVLVSDGLRPRR